MLAWIFRRCEGEADAEETAIGLVPPVGEGGIDIDGLDIDREAMAKLLEVDAEGWQEQLPQMHEHCAASATSCRRSCARSSQALEQRLAAS